MDGTSVPVSPREFARAPRAARATGPDPVARPARRPPVRLGRRSGEQRRRGAHPRAAPQARRRFHPQRARRRLSRAAGTSMSSLRNTLLAWLLGAVALIGLGGAGLSYRNALAEANGFFDNHLRETALLLRDQVRGFGAGPRLPQPVPGYDLVVQVWSLDGVRIYLSRPHAVLPGLTTLGLSTARDGGRQLAGVRRRGRRARDPGGTADGGAQAARRAPRTEDDHAVRDPGAGARAAGRVDRRAVGAPGARICRRTACSPAGRPDAGAPGGPPGRGAPDGDGAQRPAGAPRSCDRTRASVHRGRGARAAHAAHGAEPAAPIARRGRGQRGSRCRRAQPGGRRGPGGTA